MDRGVLSQRKLIDRRLEFPGSWASTATATAEALSLQNRD